MCLDNFHFSPVIVVLWDAFKDTSLGSTKILISVLSVRLSLLIVVYVSCFLFFSRSVPIVLFLFPFFLGEFIINYIAVK